MNFQINQLLASLTNARIAKAFTVLALVTATLSTTVSVPDGWHLYFTIAAAAFGAAGVATQRFQGSIAVTVTGVAIAVFGAVTPMLTQVSPKYAKAVGCMGVIISLFGKSIFGIDFNAKA